jgi:hypothetical protein
MDFDLATPEAMTRSEAFATLAGRMDGREGDYLRARRLLDGPRRTYLTVTGEMTENLSRTLGPERLGPFIDWAVANRSALKRVTLNVTGRAALSAGQWDAARLLAEEVVARDHHDILAQRICDASAERAADLATGTDGWLAGRTCNAPFRQMETRANGSVHFCCSAWQPVPVGWLADASGENFWRSSRASEIRRSVLEGDFTHCSRWHCPLIAGRTLPERSAATLPQPAPAGPERVILSHDRSCNLSCPSCRTEVIAASHGHSRTLDRLFEDRLLPILDAATEIKVTGSGDPFGSRHFRNVLKVLAARAPGARRLQLHTNGLLANRRAWDELGLWGAVRSVWVSIDAARPDTYAELRRDGDFAQLLDALDFLGGLRRAGEIDAFRLDFVVQARNFAEMGDFVDLAQRVGADGTYFLRLRNWGHVSPAEFRLQDVCSPDHPDHARLLEVLRDPRLEHPGIELGSMSRLVAEAQAEPATG